MSFSYPIVLDLEDRLIAVIGGGEVAARKVIGLLAAGATQIRVVAPQISNEIPATVERIVEPYAPRHLEGASLVFAATDRPEVNAAVVRDAHALRLLVNRADTSEEDAGDFSIPASFREGEMIVTVSAGGVPTLSAAIRDHLQDQLDPRFAMLAHALKTLRQRVLESAPSHQRRAMMVDLATTQAMEVLEQSGLEGLWNWIQQRHPAP